MAPTNATDARPQEPAPPATLDDASRALLLDITATPTAAGCEHRIIAKINTWLDGKPGLVRRDDPHGNIEIALDPTSNSGAGPALRPPG